MRTRRLIVLMALMAAVAACGTSVDTTTTLAPGTTPASTEPATTTTTTPTTTTLPTTTTTATTTTTTTAPSIATTTLFPGEPIDIGPHAGDVLAVIGVRYDDVLNVREKPGTNQPIVETLAPTYDKIVALGSARRLTQSIWLEVDVEGTRGWVSSRFVAYLGPTTDITAEVVEELGGGIPLAATMEFLAEMVAMTQVSTDPPSTVTITVAPAPGKLEITIDVIGLGDDAQAGTRLVIFGQSEESGAEIGLKSVEATELCDRGVSENGFCT